jgi:hypothetical protein
LGDAFVYASLAWLKDISFSDTFISIKVPVNLT